MADRVRIYAFIGTTAHVSGVIDPGSAALILGKDVQEQKELVREVALAVAGDVVKLTNGLYMVLTSVT